MPTPPSAASDGIGQGADLGRQARPAHDGPTGNESAMLMQQVVQRENLLAAFDRVRANKGAAGVDGMTVDELANFCRGHWSRIREQLLSGTYAPQPVRKVEIPKPDGKGVRMLGIPTEASRGVSLQRARPVVERRGEPHEPSLADRNAASGGSCEPVGRTSSFSACLTTRRMPNGTSGGVESRAGQPARLPDRLRLE